MVSVICLEYAAQQPFINYNMLHGKISFVIVCKDSHDHACSSYITDKGGSRRRPF